MGIAERYEPSSQKPFPVTAETTRWVAHLRAEDIPHTAYESANHVLLDWLGCTIVGKGAAR